MTKYDRILVVYESVLKMEMRTILINERTGDI